MSNEDERSLLVKQLTSLNNNDILIADRGYYSNHLVKKLNENKINYVLRISKHNKFYIDNINVINKSSKGCIDIKSENLKLYWYKTNKDVDKDIDNLLKLIENKKNKINEYKKQVQIDNLQYDILHKQNKEKLIALNKIKSKMNTENNDEIKLLNKELKINRENKNKLKINIDKNNNEIELLNK
jgi:hypothetical protein